jgi:ABC-2 type transport system permease protein
VTTFIYTFTFVLFLGAFSAGLGLLLFGGGDLIIFDNGILILPESSVAWRFITAYIFASWTMMTIASFALFFSSFVENAIGPIIATMGVLIVFLMVTVLPVDYFELLRPYLFTNYLGLWQKSFLDPLPWADIVTGISVLGAYSLVVTGAAWVVFVRRDVLS